MLDLYLFNGVPERSTRHYADDLHSFDEDRGTRDCLNSTKQNASENSGSGKPFAIKSAEFNFDKKAGRTKVTIR